MPFESSRLIRLVVLTATLVVPTGALAAIALPAHAAGAALPALVITEVNVDSSNRTAADGSSVDAFEFVEVRNTTGAPINLTDDGYSVVYLSGSTQKTLTHAPEVTVPAAGSLVLWPRNSALTGSAAVSEQDFRDFYAGLRCAGAYDLAVLDGQNGLNNSGSTMWIRRTEAGTTSDVAQVSWICGGQGCRPHGRVRRALRRFSRGARPRDPAGAQPGRRARRAARPDPAASRPCRA